jgi:hypothetical protein
MKTVLIQLHEGLNDYVGPQIVKLIGPSGAWAVPGVAATKGVLNLAAIRVRVDETQTQTCRMSVTLLGKPCPEYINAGTACLGVVTKKGIDYVVDSDCMVQP